MENNDNHDLGKCPSCGRAIKWRLAWDRNPIAIGITVVILEFIGKCNGCGKMFEGTSTGNIIVSGPYSGTTVELPVDITAHNANRSDMPGDR